MPIVYALIARGTSVLAEFTQSSGNFTTVSRVLLSKLSSEDGKMSYVYDNHVFHYITEQGITYLCMADEQAKRRVPFAFLEEIKQKFMTAYGDSVHSALAFSMNEGFSPVLQREMDYYNGDPSADKLTHVRSQIDEVKGVMVENIEKVLERGEKIELLVDKTDRLNQQAFRFDRASKQLQRQMYMRKVKLYAALGAGVTTIIFFCAASSCGGVTFPQC